MPKVNPDPPTTFEHRFYTVSKTFSSWFQKQLNLKKGEGVPKIQLGLVIVGKNFNLSESQRTTMRFFMCVNLLLQILNFTMIDDNKVNVMRSYTLKLEEFKSNVLEEKPWLGVEQGPKKDKWVHRKQSASTSVLRSPKSEFGSTFSRSPNAPSNNVGTKFLGKKSAQAYSRAEESTQMMSLDMGAHSEA